MFPAFNHSISFKLLPARLPDPVSDGFDKQFVLIGGYVPGNLARQPVGVPLVGTIMHGVGDIPCDLLVIVLPKQPDEQAEPIEVELDPNVCVGRCSDRCPKCRGGDDLPF